MHRLDSNQFNVFVLIIIIIVIINWVLSWLLGFYDSTRDKEDTTVGVGHSRRYCNTGYDQSQGRRPSTLKCIGPISKGDIEPNHPSEINPNSDSRSRSDGRSRRFVQYRVDQSQGQRPRSLHFQLGTSLHYGTATVSNDYFIHSADGIQTSYLIRCQAHPRIPLNC